MASLDAFQFDSSAQIYGNENTSMKVKAYDCVASAVSDAEQSSELVVGKPGLEHFERRRLKFEECYMAGGMQTILE